GAQELHALQVRGITDSANDAEAFLFVRTLDGARLHHRRHAVDPVDVVLLEDVDHVDVDEVDTELLPGDAVVLHRLQHGLGELGHLLGRGGTRGAFDPCEGVTDVLLWDPRRVSLDLESDIALLEQNRPPVAAQHRVTQAGLEAIPTGRQCAGDVAYVLVVHAQHGAEAVFLHHRACALDAVLAHAVPIDPLLPIQSGNAEISYHGVLPDPARLRATFLIAESYAGWLCRLNNIFCLLPLVFLMSCFSGVS